MTVDYAYVSDPPILADLGQTFLLIDDLFFQLNTSFTFEKGYLGLKIEGLDYSMDALELVFDGVSDTSVLLSNTIYDLKGVIGGRLGALLRSRREFLQQKLEPLLNKALAGLPDRIDFPDSDLYLAIELPRSIEADKVQLSIPIKTSL